jgi:hypothetical protein
VPLLQARGRPPSPAEHTWQPQRTPCWFRLHGTVHELGTPAQAPPEHEKLVHVQLRAGASWSHTDS